jgi:mono/diheme cytochrome c family protein
MKKLLTGVFGVLMVSGMAVSAAGAPDRTPVPQDAAKIEAGKKVYDAQKCMTCHAIDGKGMKAYPLDGVGTKLTAADIKSWIVTPDAMAAKLATKPKMKMKAFTTLPAADLDALVAYLGSLKK